MVATTGERTSARGQAPLLEWLSLVPLGIYVANLIYSWLALWIGFDSLPALTASVGTLAFFVFAAMHAALYWSPRRALVLFVVVASVSLSAEFLGTGTGALFGHYHYGRELGPKLFDMVPLVMPLAWFMIVYTAYHVTDVFGLAGGRNGSGKPKGWPAIGWAIGLSFAGALAVTAWDLMMDPQMVAVGGWVWEQPGDYFGIPISNYVGWLITAFAILLIYRFYELVSTRPVRSTTTWYGYLPVIAYGLTWLSGTSRSAQVGLPGVALAGFFGMGAFVVLAGAQLMNRHAS
jgi:uncharacterized membrane protein